MRKLKKFVSTAIIAAMAGTLCLTGCGSNSSSESSTGSSKSEKQVTVAIKVGEGGKVFGSVSAKEIAEAAKEQLGYDIDKKKMQLPNPIKVLGTTEVPIRLHTKVTAKLKVIVKEA